MSSVRVCQGQPNKKASINMGAFLFACLRQVPKTALGTDEQLVLQVVVVDARPLSLPSAKSVKVVGQRRTSLSGGK